MQKNRLIGFMELAQKAALAAGNEIMKVYEDGDFGITLKSDCSPITLADKAAHHAISEVLQLSGLPILSEEGAVIPFLERSQWEVFWLVDPLDGTKEFIKRSGEFTVNIALIENGVPIYGVLYVPVQEVLYHGGIGVGAFKISNGLKPIKLNPAKDQEVKAVVASKSHMTAETQEFIEKHFLNLPLLSMGSSLKLMLLVEQKAQVYPRFGPTMEWDIAAAQAILTGVGGYVMGFPDLKPLIYNKETLLNPSFIATAFSMAEQFHTF
jgi:3'(2'), 5'-bisphosphate nucleotidase